ncbi:MAG: hypothetical protein P0Y53_03055 [Candidatus Pseudobacter hemicellulosilyticus]|uniref:Uncharacterized protein n=1 Tax=Candidatus Pseudobacter hemicellulosilyticus TaxID=3121375 RepID=A0AAJ5WVP2_9BACT|nr:MAG: hypothetical protein P0Y53_03055 [Pseudobacter sp.]
MLKTLLFYLNRFTGVANTCISLHDLVSFFDRVWSMLEWALVGTVLLWIPLLRVAGLLYTKFGIEIPFGIPRKKSKLVLRVALWITVLASFFNLLHKFHLGHEPMKLVGLTLVHTFVAIMDFIETEETIRKIEKSKPGE